MVDYTTQHVDVFYNNYLHNQHKKGGNLRPQMFQFKQEAANSVTFYKQFPSYTTEYVFRGNSVVHPVTNTAFNVVTKPYVTSDLMDQIELATVPYKNVAVVKLIDALVEAIDRRIDHTILTALIDAYDNGSGAPGKIPANNIIPKTITPTEGATATANRLNVRQILHATARLNQFVNPPKYGRVFIGQSASIDLMLQDVTRTSGDFINNKPLIEGLENPSEYKGRFNGIDFFGIPDFTVMPGQPGGIVPTGTGADAEVVGFLFNAGPMSPLCTVKSFPDSFKMKEDPSAQYNLRPYWVTSAGAGVMSPEEIIAIVSQEPLQI